MTSISRIVLLSAAVAACIGATGCADMSRSDRATAGGAAVGGVAGAVLTGGSTGGAVAGAVVGGVVGHEVEKHD